VQDKGTLIIYDLSGRQLLKQNIQIAAGNNVLDINEFAKFAKGTYLLSVLANQQNQTIKIIKNN